MANMWTAFSSLVEPIDNGFIVRVLIDNGYNTSEFREYRATLEECRRYQDDMLTKVDELAPSIEQTPETDPAIPF